MKKHYYSLLLIFAIGTLTNLNAINLGDNDTCVGAIALNCGDSIVGNTSDNTNTGGGASPDEFYKYTGDGFLEEITISLCSDVTDYDSFLRVYTDCTLSTVIITNDDSCNLQSEVSFLSDGTSTYYIMVEGYDLENGNFELEITCASGLTNDSCTFATPIACGDTVVGETTMDTDSGFNESNDEFFIFTGEGFEQEVIVTMCDGGTNYDSWLRVFTSCDLNDQIVDNDDTCGTQSEVMFTSDGVSTYIIMVEGYQNNTGDFSLSISCSGPPMPPPNDLIENAIDISDAAQGPSGFFIDPAVNAPDATPEMGTPNDCDLAGIEGVWYHFTPQSSIAAFGSIESPSGISAVIFFTAPNDNAALEDLTRVDQNGNPCFTGASSEIIAEGGQTYYAFAANKGDVTDFNFEFAFLGLEDNVFKDFVLYPNPVKNELFLDARLPLEQIQIVNIIGQTILQQDVNTQSTNLDISDLNAGTYFLKATIEGISNTYQFIKQ